MQFLSLSGGAIGGIVAGAAAFVLLVVFIWYFATKNGLIAVRNDTEEAYSAMDIHMKKRYDLIPNLVETCKGYMKHESETFVKVTQARSIAMNASAKEKADAEKAFANSLHTLLNAVSESYPALKADSQFRALSSQLEQIEHEIAQSRKYYNAKVKLYNNKIEQFPSSIVANRMRLEKKSYFEIEDASERVAPKVNFNDSPVNL